MEETTAQATTSSATIKTAPENQHRQAYGTAKTENLRDSGMWRLILPTFIVLSCLALLAIPLIILINLFVNSLDPSAYTRPLLWLWIVMMIIEAGAAIVVGRGLLRIFLTQAGNYR